MSRVLHRPGVAAAPRIVAPVEPTLDPVLRGLVDRAAAAAHEQGFAAGRQAGREEGRREVAELGASLARTVTELIDALRAMKAEQATGTVELASAIAAHVLDREPGDGGRAVLERVRGWLAEVDDRPVQVAVNADEADVLEAALAGTEGVQVVADPALVAGEARLTGTWSAAELCRAARWEEVRDALAEPLPTDGVTGGRRG